MGGLMELGPMTETISVMGSTLTIRPITVAQMIDLFIEFPVLIELLGGAKGKEAASKAGPAAIAKVIATSTGEADNPEAIAKATMIGAGKVAEILDKIMDITLEDGAESFMKRIGKVTSNTKTLMSVDSSTESDAPWSASLTGDAPRKTRLPLRHAS